MFSASTGKKNECNKPWKLVIISGNWGKQNSWHNHSLKIWEQNISTCLNFEWDPRPQWNPLLNFSLAIAEAFFVKWGSTFKVFRKYFSLPLAHTSFWNALVISNDSDCLEESVNEYAEKKLQLNALLSLHNTFPGSWCLFYETRNLKTTRIYILLTSFREEVAHRGTENVSDISRRWI